ncbi:hypothetical protein C8J56DRAFT_1033011 [Mycena floridula]|nr:hypothetical protein C8J56DRAFT_1033011 [Mycena floridula]
MLILPVGIAFAILCSVSATPISVSQEVHLSRRAGEQSSGSHRLPDSSTARQQRTSSSKKSRPLTEEEKKRKLDAEWNRTHPNATEEQKKGLEDRRRLKDMSAEEKAKRRTQLKTNNQRARRAKQDNERAESSKAREKSSAPESSRPRAPANQDPPASAAGRFAPIQLPSIASLNLPRPPPSGRKH